MSRALGQTVGRQKELAELEALLARLDDGAPGCVAIEGDPGIGKTRLLRELREWGDERGHLVLTGSVEEFERDMPFGVWVDALDAYVASRELGGGDPLLSALGAVLPSLRENSGGRLELIAEERFRAHRAVRRLLELLAADKPLVLILDDLHWADAASVELIGALLRRELDGPVLLALALRAGQGPPKLRASLFSAEATLIELTPLSQGEAAELIGSAITGSQLGAIVRESAGNPFYALQLARAASLPAREGGRRPSNGVAGVPAGLADALMVEVGAVSEPARTLIEGAAIAGDPFELDLGYQIAELSPEAGVEALDELLEAGLLHDTALPRRFAFRHPLVRRAVYESTRAGWRLNAHARAAALLGAQGAPAAARAHHVEQSAAMGDAGAVALLLEAADAARARSPAGAARWYEAALRLMSPADSPGPPGGPHRAGRGPARRGRERPLLRHARRGRGAGGARRQLPARGPDRPVGGFGALPGPPRPGSATPGGGGGPAFGRGVASRGARAARAGHGSAVRERSRARARAGPARPGGGTGPG